VTPIAVCIKKTVVFQERAAQKMATNASTTVKFHGMTGTNSARGRAQLANLEHTATITQCVLHMLMAIRVVAILRDYSIPIAACMKNVLVIRDRVAQKTQTNVVVSMITVVSVIFQLAVEMNLEPGYAEMASQELNVKMITIVSGL
jgi:hypothetical protein|tara:strand:+ start:295 stop:732 length:438 start_codon:yes stop_codon:yes gene_type:complete